jgi:hypothetical protein
MAGTRLTRKERWTLTMVFACSMLAGLLLYIQPINIQQKIILVFGAVIFPLLILRSIIYAWNAYQGKQLLKCLLATVLATFLLLGFLGELSKLIMGFRS